jgi:hypothetical protein
MDCDRRIDTLLALVQNTLLQLAVREIQTTTPRRFSPHE